MSFPSRRTRDLACSLVTTTLLFIGGCRVAEQPTDTGVRDVDATLPPEDVDVRCGSDLDCDDGIACNGSERCATGDAADARGCSPGVTTCSDGLWCDPVRDLCVPLSCLASPDEDRDGELAPECGGADCDDADPTRSSLLPEACEGSVDEDCDTRIDEEPGAGAWCASRAHASGACTAGSCGLTCEPGWFDCDGLDATGCESDPTSDPLNCGACDAACVPGSWCEASTCGPTTTWSVELPVTSGHATAAFTAAHPAGGVVVSIRVEGTIVFDGTPFAFVGGSLVVRVDSNGQPLWAVPVENGAVTDIDVDIDGTTHVVGTFRGRIDVGIRSWTASVGAFHARIADTGGVTALTAVESDVMIAFSGVAAQPGGGVVLTGVFVGGATIGGRSYSSAGEEDAFVISEDGPTAPWHRVLGGSASDALFDIASGPDGTLVATGLSRGSVTIDGMTAMAEATGDGWLVRFRPDQTADVNRTLAPPGLSLALAHSGAQLFGVLSEETGRAIVALDGDLRPAHVAGPFAEPDFVSAWANAEGIVVAGVTREAPAGWMLAAPTASGATGLLARFHTTGNFAWARRLGWRVWGAVAELGERTYATVHCMPELPCDLGETTLTPGPGGSIVIIRIDG